MIPINPNLTPAQALQAQGQWQQVGQLQQQAVTPLSGAQATAPGGGMSGALAKLATAMLAAQAKNNWKKQYGIQAPTVPGTAAAAAAGTPSTPDEEPVTE